MSAAYIYSSCVFRGWRPTSLPPLSMAENRPQLTAQTLMRLTPRLPAGWAEQRKLLGFR